MLGMGQALIPESASRPLQERITPKPRIQATVRKPSSGGGPDHFNSHEKRSEAV
jgi:hypothetical protein